MPLLPEAVMALDGVAAERIVALQALGRAGLPHARTGEGQPGYGKQSQSTGAPFAVARKTNRPRVVALQAKGRAASPLLAAPVPLQAGNPANRQAKGSHRPAKTRDADRLRRFRATGMPGVSRDPEARRS